MLLDCIKISNFDKCPPQNQQREAWLHILKFKIWIKVTDSNLLILNQIPKHIIWSPKNSHNSKFTNSHYFKPPKKKGGKANN